MTARASSPVTARARTFVDERSAQAADLGRRAGDLAGDPSALVAELKAGFQLLADPEYLAGQRRIAPGIGQVAGVRAPLLAQVSRGLRAATRQDRAPVLLDLAQAMLRDPLLELHWLAFDLLRRTMPAEPELTWQLVRAESRRASDWITVDSLAHVAGRGVLLEPYRWAELEQLVYSPSRWERRLAGSTVATIPFEDRRAGRTPEVAGRGRGIVAQLIGDREPDVQKSLSWALRNLLAVEHDATLSFIEAEAELAARTQDGHRAWVLRDTFAKLDGPTAARLRAQLAGIRRRPDAPSTSRAAAAAAEFLSIGQAVPPAERTIIDRSQPTA